MSPFESPAEQARYEELVTEGKTPEEAHAQVELERAPVETGDAVVGSATPIEGDDTPAEVGPEGLHGADNPPGGNPNDLTGPPGDETTDDPDSDAEQAQPSTEAERNPEAFEAPAQQKVESSHAYTGEKGNPSPGERPDAETGTDEQPLVSDRPAGEAEELPQATVRPSAQTQPR